MTHEHYMARALQLAELGRGKVSPNPLVGCVIVHDGKIIGEGFHQQYGEAHAEVNAVASVWDKNLLKESDVYVTLEPCSHFGKTPPCADLLIKHQVRKVIICNLDTFSLVNGQGIEKLQKANIEVITGILAEKGRKLNARFFTFVEKKRPYIILKWAETADGFIAKPNYQSLAISNPLAKRWVHRWRSEEDVIMVGTRTARYDNPQLNVRDWTGKNPIRVVIDKNLSLPQSLHLFDDSQNTICYNYLDEKVLGSTIFVKINSKKNVLEEILADLYQRKVQSIFVEGGTQLLQSFIDANLWDEIRQIRSPKNLGNGIKAPLFSGKKIKTEWWDGNEFLSYEP